MDMHGAADVKGALCLAVSIPIVRPLVLTFGSPEFFMIGLLGVTFVVSLSGGNLLKGLISGAIGFCLAMIGIDPISGIQRYTFGQLFLWDGIGLVPVTVGLFAIPEVIDLAVQGGSIAKEKTEKLGGVMEGVKDTFRHWWLVIRCSALGAYVGVIPGMGGAVGQWIAYAHAVQSSPNKERFGKGAVEGVLGPGAANNSVLGGAFIPTVAFGVPGSVIMAILLGAFVIQGIVPGPDMLLPPPKGKLDLTFSFVWIIVVSNLITVGICFLFLNHLAKITQVRAGLLIPFIILLVYLGGFAKKNAFEDMLVVLAFGALGWVMVKLDWQRPPLILGLVLGPLMENRLFLSTDNYGVAWLWRPGVIILFILTLTGIFYPVIKERWRSREKLQAQLEAVGVTIEERVEEEKGALRLWDICFTGLLVVTLAGALWQSREFGYRAGLFPWVIGFPVLTLAVAQLGLELAGKTKKTIFSEGDVSADLPEEVIRSRTASIIGWIVGFLIAVWLLGFSLAVAATTLLYLKIAAREKWPITIAITLLSWGFFYGLFDYALHIPFPEGQLFAWLAL
ncbi:MAG: tripartite tricarboxylate transporter permease [Deltaproteobacteria bacterium]|nr:tripartite tricarboxylate transporter permease [Deltaproteobacteria bacterium]